MRGESVYANPGTYSWTCPTGVTSVSVVCIGGGGGGRSASNNSWSGGGGAGGALAYINDFSVTAGNSYTVVVGDGGDYNLNTNGSAGGQSSVSYTHLTLQTSDLV